MNLPSVGQMVRDLYDLGDCNIKLVLFKLDEIQGEIAAEQATTFLATEIRRLSVREIVVQELIRELWLQNFGAEHGCFG